VFIFAIIFGMRTWMMNVQSLHLEELQQEELRLDRDLNELLETEQGEYIHPIGEIITALPVESSELEIVQDLIYARNAAGLALIENYRYNIDMDASNPFEENLPNTMVFIEIELELTTSSITELYAFIDAVLGMDRIYYIYSADVSLGTGITTDLVIYTFYNAIDVD
jgi:hypothetical protein